MIVAVLAVSGARLLTQNSTRTPSSRGGRSNTIALSMGAKSLIFVAYQVLTEYVSKFRRWASAKANFILNCIDIVSWAAVVFMGIQANLKMCSGTGCLLSWIVIALGGCLSLLSVVTSYISWGDYRYFRANKVRPGQTATMEELSETESKPYRRSGRA
ncbi:hypothetical protein PVAG01_03137 [Phlyctema vagabunda]|uniref:MARVEL domain-containing protein n=1 Tax=Phlyctema vagabunda TaxID=108571 RepID=A0ABR4PSM7_9HELO